MSQTTSLVTGAAGFIGAHLSRALLDRGEHVVGVDNFNDYYDPRLKRDRVAALLGSEMVIHEHDIADREAMEHLISHHAFDRIFHIAAQAGVRYSLENPHAYASANLIGYTNILEAARRHGVGHLIYASSSSVYGADAVSPFQENAAADHPVSFYAATKRANELMAHSYSHLFGLRTTGLRLFTVYGPWGRPDMAPMLFAKAIENGKELQVFNHGRMQRDFTYIDDIVAGIIAAGDTPPAESDGPPARVLNLGFGKPVELLDFIGLLESALGRKAKLKFEGMQPGDMVATFCDGSLAAKTIGFAPQTSPAQGVERFIEWFRAYHSERDVANSGGSK